MAGMETIIPGGKRAMTPEISHLCTNCSYEATCRYARNPNLPVIFCEEFSCGEPVNVSPGGLGTVSEVQVRSGSPVQRLCMNCDHTVYCALKQPDLPVDFCNEYR